jgi:hypothetical protein
MLCKKNNFKHGLDKNGNVFFELYFNNWQTFLYKTIVNQKTMILINCQQIIYQIEDTDFDIVLSKHRTYYKIKISKK